MGETVFGGRRKYEQFVMDGVMKDMNITFWKGVRGQTVLGSNDFVDWIYERFLSAKKVDRRELTGLKDLQTGPGTVEEIARAVSREFEVEEEGLNRPRGVPQAQSILMELCRVHLSRRMSFAEMGRRLGGISVSAISQNKKRLEESRGKILVCARAFKGCQKGWDRNLVNSAGLTPISLPFAEGKPEGYGKQYPADACGAI